MRIGDGILSYYTIATSGFHDTPRTNLEIHANWQPDMNALSLAIPRFT